MSVSLGGNQEPPASLASASPCPSECFFQRSNLDTGRAGGLLVLLQIDQELAETLLA